MCVREIYRAERNCERIREREIERIGEREREIEREGERQTCSQKKCKYIIKPV